MDTSSAGTLNAKASRLRAIKNILINDVCMAAPLVCSILPFRPRRILTSRLLEREAGFNPDLVTLKIVEVQTSIWLFNVAANDLKRPCDTRIRVFTEGKAERRSDKCGSALQLAKKIALILH